MTDRNHILAKLAFLAFVGLCAFGPGETDQHRIARLACYEEVSRMPVLPSSHADDFVYSMQECIGNVAKW